MHSCLQPGDHYQILTRSMAFLHRLWPPILILNKRVDFSQLQLFSTKAFIKAKITNLEVHQRYMLIDVIFFNY